MDKKKYRPKYTKPLTQREIDILCMLCLPNIDIAYRTYKTPASVKQIRNIIFKKLGVHSRSEALITAIRQGVIDLWDIVLPTDVF